MRISRIISKAIALKPIVRFDFSILIIFILALLNVLYKMRITAEGIHSAENLWSPTWLLFGPLLYYAFNDLTHHKQFIRFVKVHFVPFYIFMAFYLVEYFSLNGNPWESMAYKIYQNSFFVIPISLIGYATKIFANRKMINALLIKGELLFALCGLFSIIGILYILMYLCWGVFDIDMGVDYRIFTYAILLIIELFILRYAYGVKFSTSLSKEDVINSDHSYVNSGLKEDLAIEYIQRINLYFNDDQSFLNPDISIDLLSKQLNIQKHHFSELFNVHIGKNFYTFIAERRIKYAVRRLNEEQGKLKIESLAYECGFNSKTSFNRYFKQIIGCTPLEYLVKGGELIHRTIALPQGMR